MTTEQLKDLTKDLAEITREYVTLKIAEAVAPLREKIAALEARPDIKYCGTWHDSTTYEPGDFTTFAGSMWHCRARCHGRRPGEAPDAWQLAVKRGADGASK